MAWLVTLLRGHRRTLYDCLIIYSHSMPASPIVLKNSLSDVDLYPGWRKSSAQQALAYWVVLLAYNSTGNSVYLAAEKVPTRTWLTDMMPSHCRWSISHSPLVSIQHLYYHLHLSPAVHDHSLSIVLSPDFFSTCSWIAVSLSAVLQCPQ